MTWWSYSNKTQSKDAFKYLLADRLFIQERCVVGEIKQIWTFHLYGTIVLGNTVSTGIVQVCDLIHKHIMSSITRVSVWFNSGTISHGTVSSFDLMLKINTTRTVSQFTKYTYPMSYINNYLPWVISLEICTAGLILLRARSQVVYCNWLKYQNYRGLYV